LNFSLFSSSYVLFLPLPIQTFSVSPLLVVLILQNLLRHLADIAADGKCSLHRSVEVPVLNSIIIFAFVLRMRCA
jgi:hypothetical protein